MDIHKNARLTLRSREQLALFVLSGQTLSAAARRFLVTPKTAAKWVGLMGGFYKRGCQEKRPFPCSEGRRFSDIQPLCADTKRLCRSVVLLS